MNGIDRIAEHLTSGRYRFRQCKGERIDIGFDGDNTWYQAVITVRGPMVSVLVQAVIVAPRDRLEETLRLANMLNALRVPYGHFWVHPTERRLAFEVHVPVVDDVSQEQVRRSMVALGAVDYFYPLFARVIWQGMSAEEAMMSESTSNAADEHPESDPPLDLAV
jgi:hypothetical protein